MTDSMIYGTADSTHRCRCLPRHRDHGDDNASAPAPPPCHLSAATLSRVEGRVKLRLLSANYGTPLPLNPESSMLPLPTLSTPSLTHSQALPLSVASSEVDEDPNDRHPRSATPALDAPPSPPSRRSRQSRLRRLPAATREAEPAYLARPSSPKNLLDGDRLRACTHLLAILRNATARLAAPTACRHPAEPTTPYSPAQCIVSKASPAESTPHPTPSSTPPAYVTLITGVPMLPHSDYAASVLIFRHLRAPFRLVNLLNSPQTLAPPRSLFSRWRRVAWRLPARRRASRTSERRHLAVSATPTALLFRSPLHLSTPRPSSRRAAESTTSSPRRVENTLQIGLTQ
ncbi:hypothetical protein R3P38DRAFT_3236022 [Favolaschia claudopus]|uniref:Uncharacterized protein n=1 Tax=Favolaschia claudopus TaxID=2862362 RepID=A0AAV9ZCV6_9AGAR